MRQTALWTTVSEPDYSLPEFPRVKSAGCRSACIDFETTGLDYRKDKPVGVAIRTDDGRSSYLPWAHRRGPNLDENAARRWMTDELEGLDLENLNIKFEHQMARPWGVDFERMGCRLHEVQHPVALLDDNRKKFDLDTLGQELLGEGKVQLPVPPQDIAGSHASLIAPYAIRDVEVAHGVRATCLPKISEQGLGRVLNLEDDLIFCVAHMERNAAPIDVEKLELWRVQARVKQEEAQAALNDLAGRDCSVKSAPHLTDLFRKLSLEIPGRTEKGAPSFAADALELVTHPVGNMIREIRSIADLRSKYLDKYSKVITSDGLLPYSLHQLRGVWDEGGAALGTVTGRFSSSNVNIQQVFKVSRQLERAGIASWIIRELFLPGSGLFFSADMSQVEYRIFAHMSANRKLIEAYSDPTCDFHAQVAELVGLNRRDAKDVNFMKLYGGGVGKMALMTGYPIDKCEDLVEQYDRKFPDARRLLKLAEKVARKRGFVRTMFGRRRRYSGPRARYYSALNAAIQGTAADVLKLKMLALYPECERLGITLRMTVHDEFCGDIVDDPGALEALGTFLDESVIPMDVPIVWSTNTGINWREAA